MRGQPDATPATVAPGAPRVPGWGRVWRALAVVLALAVLGGGFWGVLSLRARNSAGGSHRQVQLFSLGADVTPGGIAAGPDGNIWVTEPSQARVVRITPAGAITEVPLPHGTVPYAIVAGPDGALWFVDANGPRLGRLTTAGTVMEYPLPEDRLAGIGGLALGPDGNLWYTAGQHVGRVTLRGAVTVFPFPPDYNAVDGTQMPIVAGPDGNLWAFAISRTTLWRITTRGVFTPFGVTLNIGCFCGALAVAPDHTFWVTTMSDVLSVSTSGEVLYDYPVATGKLPLTIAVGPDHALWLTEAVRTGDAPQTVRLARMAPDGTFTTYPVPAVDTGRHNIDVTPGVGMPGIVVGPYGALWFLNYSTVGRLLP